MKENTVQH